MRQTTITEHEFTINAELILAVLQNDRSALLKAEFAKE